MGSCQKQKSKCIDGQVPPTMDFQSPCCFLTISCPSCLPHHFPHLFSVSLSFLLFLFCTSSRLPRTFLPNCVEYSASLVVLINFVLLDLNTSFSELKHSYFSPSSLVSVPNTSTLHAPSPRLVYRYPTLSSFLPLLLRTPSHSI